MKEGRRYAQRDDLFDLGDVADIPGIVEPLWWAPTIRARAWAPPWRRC